MQNVGDKKSSTGRNQQPAAFPVIPGYRFLQTIARSPKSEIHVAHSQELGHNVAIKVLRTGPLSESPAGEEERTIARSQDGRKRRGRRPSFGGLDAVRRLP